MARLEVLRGVVSPLKSTRSYAYMKNGEFNGFGRQFGAILDNLLSNEGFAPPICSLIVGRNGAITAGRYSASDDDHLTYKPIAEYVPEKDAGFRPPVNCLLIDGAS